MRVLFLTCHLPYPPVSGGRVRELELLRRLGAEVVVGGIKVKMLEALSRGKAIVSTSVGVQGLGEDAHRSIEVADDARPYAAACARLLLDHEERKRLERRALAFASTSPNWDDAAASVLECYRS